MRVAVFVDAGYVYAQGSTTLSGLKTPKPRDQLELNEAAIAKRLKALAATTSNGKELLRIYWYDGAPQSGPSAAQERLAQLGDVKLRLGFLNSVGQQKGVDSLIVTDLMELARNKAISDAVVVTGDEDIRVGVAIAQSHGVRVHVLGLAGPPAKGTQSNLLLQEADTVSTWSKADVSGFLTHRVSIQKPAEKPPVAKPAAAPSKSAPDKTAQPKPVNAAAPSAAHTRRTSELVLEHFKDDPGKIRKAVKIVQDGKELPGYMVSVLKAELEKALARKATKSEQKDARDALAVRLREMV